MEILEKFLQPSVIGPMIGLVAVIGAFTVKGMNVYFNHQERIEKIRNGIDPDAE
jgi:hypothetical protein